MQFTKFQEHQICWCMVKFCQLDKISIRTCIFVYRQLGPCKVGLHCGLLILLFVMLVKLNYLKKSVLSVNWVLSF